MRAFTLIEILVVITIVVLLIALLMPALATARTTSHLVQSLSNEKQVTGALLVYAEDFNTSLPLSVTSGQYTVGPPAVLYGSTIPTWGWTLFNGGYVSSINVYWGPGRDVKGLDFDTMRAQGSTSDWLYISYAANSEALTQYAEMFPSWQLTYNANTYPNGIVPTKLSEGRTPPPDRFMLLCEAWNNSNSFTKGYAGFYRIEPFNINTPSSQVNILPFNYNGVIPRSFLDGHGMADNGTSMGWSTSAIPPIAAGMTIPTRPGPYSGNWVYTTPTQYRRLTPWYAQYRK